MAPIMCWAGIILPLDGVGPDQLNIETLVSRVRKGEAAGTDPFALNPTSTGGHDDLLHPEEIADISLRITTIARGIAFGGELNMPMR